MRTIQNSTVMNSITTLVTVMIERSGATGPDLNLLNASLAAARVGLSIRDQIDVMSDDYLLVSGWLCVCLSDCAHGAQQINADARLQILSRPFPIIDMKKYTAAAYALVASCQLLMVVCHAASVAAGLSGISPAEAAPQAYAAVAAAIGWNILPQHTYGNESGVGIPR